MVEGVGASILESIDSHSVLMENCSSSSINRPSTYYSLKKLENIVRGGEFYTKYNIIHARILLEVENHKEKLGTKGCTFAQKSLAIPA